MSTNLTAQAMVTASGKTPTEIASAMGVSVDCLVQILFEFTNAKLTTVARFACATQQPIIVTATSANGKTQMSVSCPAGVGNGLLQEADLASLEAAALCNSVARIVEIAEASCGFSRAEIAEYCNLSAQDVASMIDGDGNYRLSDLGVLLSAMGFRLRVTTAMA